MAAQAQWQLSGDYFENCNCNVVCPCLVSKSRTPNVAADRGRMRRRAALPYRQRTLRRRGARRPQRGARSPYAWADGRRKLVGRRLHR